MIFFIIFFLIEVIFGLYGFITKLSSNYSNYFGYSIVMVRSDSMKASNINKGSKYLVHQESSYQLDDIIVFEHNDELWFHQIVSITESETYLTKGSSNPNIDPFVISKEDIRGRYTGHCVDNLFPALPLTIILSLYLGYMSYCIVWLIKYIKSDNTEEDDSKKRKNNNLSTLVSIILVISVLAGCYYVSPVFSAVSADCYFEASVEFTPQDIGSSYITYNTNGGTVTGYDNNSGETHIIIPESNNGNEVTRIDSGVFNNNNSVQVIDIPSTVTEIGYLNFLLCPNLEVIIVRAETPPEWFSLLGWQLGSNVTIYVPDDSINLYKTASGWNRYPSQIKKLSKYNP